MPEPISIEEIPKRGAVYMGEPLVRFVAILRNGNQVAIDIKEHHAESEKEKRISTWKKKIIPFLESKGMPLSRKQIAGELNGKVVTGWFGQSIKAMVDSGDLTEDEDGNLIPNSFGE